MKALMTILLLAFTVSAQTVDNNPPFDDWQFVGQGTGKHGVINIHIAPKTIARNGDAVKVWIQVKSHYGSFFREAWEGPGPMPEIDLVRMFLTFDCKAKTMKNGETLLYNSSNALVQKYKAREKVKEKPGTISWAAFEYFCEKEGKKLTGPPTLKP